MPTDTQSERVLALAAQRGLLRACDLRALGIARVVLTRLVLSGALERVGRGVYGLAGKQGAAARHGTEYEGLATIAVKVPKAVFCLLTALQIHELTTQLPRQAWIAMPQGSHAPKMDYPPIKMVQFSGDALTQGIVVVQAEQVALRVYGVAKTVADCFKHRNTVGLDVALEALRETLITRKATADELWRFAKVCRVANVMRPYLEALGHGG
jgi:predicted transcriptional regulator of viral defense system